jgi:hypothetical protein
MRILDPAPEAPAPEIGFHVKEEPISYRTRGKGVRMGRFTLYRFTKPVT